MDWIIDIVTNPFLLTGLGSWFIAQVLKTIIHAVLNKKIVWERMFGDGGMPSGHSATVTSLAAFAGLRLGFNSFEFAVAAVLAVVVCHDAMGIRQQAGKQAVILNELVEAFQRISEEKIAEEQLKIFVGHTFLQVVVGMALGLANALLMNWLLP